LCCCCCVLLLLLHQQLEVLFKRSLHKLALDLALCHEADPELIAAIRQRWGER
jgi:hypothetical protein